MAGKETRNPVLMDVDGSPMRVSVVRAVSSSGGDVSSSAVTITASGKVVNNFDEKVIVYSDAPNGVIDYIAFLNNSVEVARDTYGYDINGNVDSIT